MVLRKNMARFTILVLLSCLILKVLALYEDQAGKFDWRQQMVGRPAHVLFDASGAGGYKRLVMATEDNVLAALNHKSGQLIWRRVLERGESGHIHLLLPSNGDLVTYSGHNLLRVWCAATGLLISEAALDIAPASGAAGLHVLTSGRDQLLALQLGPSANLHRIARGSGQVTTAPLSTPWAGAARCVSGAGALLCWDAAARALHVFTAASGRFSTQPLPPALSASQEPRVRHLGNDLFAIAASGRLTVVRVTPSFEVVQEMAGDMACLAQAGGEQVLYVGKYSKTGKVPAVEFSVSAPGGGQVAAPAGAVSLTARHGTVSACHVTVAPRRDGGQLAARALLVGDDDAVTMTTVGGDVLWTREEALASVVAVEVVDLPMSAGDVSIEEEFGDPAAGPVSAFVRRMTSQWSQLASLAASVVSGEVIQGSDVTHLTRDKFNLHKMLVVVTACGKVRTERRSRGHVSAAELVT
ncbi:ER membrane protein complex subunit 1-like [Pollicipes pollicipes]|uniref:ER membrane protein complex subunit 1-like n=1 Tax=Pollicipes pollicipes TaxID=41117 RepID=UPI001884B001|nr:ER membrane protein complex subunit 1-like [Pollicipes pollicipes]